MGFITDAILARTVVANGLNADTAVKVCMRRPVVAIEVIDLSSKRFV